MSVSDEDAAERGAINLARIAPFRLGSLEVAPATRQLNRGTRRETLEPRVMQVMVALWEAGGAVVSRDDLIARCWAGRIVGDNAIQRAISRLREIAGGIGENCFELETVNKVGYRLIAHHAPAASALPEQQASDGSQSSQRRRGRFIAAGVALAGVVLATGIIWTPPPADSVASLAIVAHGSGQASSNLTDGLTADLARFANARGGRVAFVRGAPADYRLDVSEERVGDDDRADITLFKTGSAGVLWSVALAAPASNPALLRERAANAVSGITQCAMEVNNDLGRTTDATLPSVFSACETLNAESDASAVERWRRVVAREAENAPAVATLAFVEAEWSTGVGWSGEAAALRAAAWRHLQNARSMDGSLGLTYAAEALLVPLSHYGERIAILDRGLAVDPNCAGLHMTLTEARQEVGWSEDAVASARRAAALAPNSPRVRSDLVSVLAYAGYLSDARSELQAAERLWPDSSAVKEVRYRVDLRFGDPARLIRTIDRGSVLPNTSKSFASGPERALLLARADPTPANVENAARVAIRYQAPPFALQNLVVLGRIDQAYSFIRDPGRLAILRDAATDTLFRSYMRPFVLDRRFMPLASRLGLVRFWQTRGWPDFCYDKDLPYDCKTEARRLHPKPV